MLAIQLGVSLKINYMKSKIWLSSPHIGKNELQNVNEAFATNWIAPLGPHVNAFEQGLQTQTQTKHAAVLSSGTSAIHLALILLGVMSGDTVFCQSITFWHQLIQLHIKGLYLYLLILRRTLGIWILYY